MRNLSNPLSILRQRLSEVKNAIAPRDCFLCGQSGCETIICDSCASVFPELGPACPFCALPTGEDTACGQCQRQAPVLDAARALFKYTPPVDGLLQALKYQHRLPIARYFGGLLAKHAEELDVDSILPMPLSLNRLRERGFNQALLLARALAKDSGVPLVVDSVLRRDGLPQEGLSREERLQNVVGIFKSRQRFDRQRVLLVDDVMTTGATLNELARVLKSLGAQSVQALVVARTFLD